MNNDNDYIFTIVGKLYIDMVNAQKIIDMLQSKLKEKDAEIVSLKQDRTEL